MNWRYSVHNFLSDTMLEPLYWRWIPRSVRRRGEHWHYYVVEKPMTALFCKVAGHFPTVDHCGMAAHDLCLWCGKSMPGQAERSHRA